MGKALIILFLALLVLSGCTSIIRDDCPAEFIVRKTDRVRCYEEETHYTTLGVANFFTFGVACGFDDLNCVPQKVLEERTCPNACIQSYETGAAE